MTLAIRLGILTLGGLLVAFFLSRSLWPSSVPVQVVQGAAASSLQYQGSFVAKGKAGAYKLELMKGRKAKLQFVDRKGNKFAYRGDVVDGEIVWMEQIKKGRWIKLEQPISDPLTSLNESTFDLKEGRFQRIDK